MKLSAVSGVTAGVSMVWVGRVVWCWQLASGRVSPDLSSGGVGRHEEPPGQECGGQECGARGGGASRAEV